MYAMPVYLRYLNDWVCLGSTFDLRHEFDNPYAGQSRFDFTVDVSSILQMRAAPDYVEQLFVMHNGAVVTTLIGMQVLTGYFGCWREMRTLSRQITNGQSIHYSAPEPLMIYKCNLTVSGDIPKSSHYSEGVGTILRNAMERINFVAQLASKDSYYRQQLKHRIDVMTVHSSASEPDIEFLGVTITLEQAKGIYNTGKLA